MTIFICAISGVVLLYGIVTSAVAYNRDERWFGFACIALGVAAALIGGAL